MQLKKIALFGATMSSTVLLLAATSGTAAPQDPPRGQDAAEVVSGVGAAETSGLAEELARARREIERLRAECIRTAEAEAQATRELRSTRNRVERLQREHDEALDLIANTGMLMNGRHQHSSCSASRRRVRDLLTYYQWMHGRGHQDRANKLLTDALGEQAKSARYLNEIAWNLMTDQDCTGKYDTAALALAQRMLQHGDLRHEHLDTVALAMFLNGRVDDAIQIQQRALESNDRESYRRRLMVYRAARKNGQQPSGVTEIAEAAGGE